MTKGNSNQVTGNQTRSWPNPLFGLERIREAAARDKTCRFTALMHHLTPRLLEESYMALRKDASPGIDGQLWAEYGTGLEERLVDLHDRIHSGRYRAQPSKRIYVPKEDGSKRPIGIATLEDKIVQGGVVRILERIYEEDFLGMSYGFRPGKGQHDALDAISVGIVRCKINWVLDADLRKFFDSINHEKLLACLSVRIGDRRLLRLIQKWLRAGVSENGKWSKTTVGTPQGAVISPLLANIFLHYVLDQWVIAWRRKARGDVIIVRFADDFVMGFQYRWEAEKFQCDLAIRLAEYCLELNTEKTRLIEFGRFAESNRAARGEGKPETFNFLGFTHACARTHASGRFTIRRQPIAKRLRKKLQEVKAELRRRMHDKVPEVGQWLKCMLDGVLNYYAVPGACPVLTAFRNQICRLWFRTLRRRSQKSGTLSWARVRKLLNTWIPPVQVCHPYPDQRLTYHPR